MAGTADRDQKTEAPTPKRKADAVRDGDVLQSRDWSTALVMVAGAAWLMMAGPWFVGGAMELVASGLTLGRRDITDFDPGFSLARLLPHMAGPVAALFAATLLAAVAGPALIGSLGFRTSAMAFKANRIDPMAGLKRMFGTHGAIELVKALARVGLLGCIGYWLISASLPAMLALGAMDLKLGIMQIGGQLQSAVIALTAGLALIAFLDVPIQFIRRNARLRMTKQEVREEMRQSDGAPELKQAIRQRQHSILSGSARKAMADASVVLTNPTHFAVALRYRPGVDTVPIVVARGREEVALAIREMAQDNGVPVLNYPQLTRGIYFTTRAGQPISEDLYIAVATILAFVFNIERAMAEGMAQPSVIVPDEKAFDENGRKIAKHAS